MANRIGQKFNRLTIIAQSGLSSTALCDCGGVITTTTYNIKSGRTSSCGCFRREVTAGNSRTHGLTETPTWYSWVSMRRRCKDTEAHNASSYALKGITYDPRWELFENFAFAFAGMLAWNVFSGLLGRMSTSLVGNAQLVSKIYFPRLVLPLSSAGSVLVVSRSQYCSILNSPRCQTA